MLQRGEREAKIIYQSKRDLSESGEEIELRTTQVWGLAKFRLQNSFFQSYILSAYVVF